MQHHIQMRKKSSIYWFVPASNAITSTTVYTRHCTVDIGKVKQTGQAPALR